MNGLVNLISNSTEIINSKVLIKIEDGFPLYPPNHPQRDYLIVAEKNHIGLESVLNDDENLIDHEIICNIKKLYQNWLLLKNSVSYYQTKDYLNWIKSVENYFQDTNKAHQFIQNILSNDSELF